MTMYHINPKTGNPNICKAEKGGCPFANDEEHFPTKRSALEAYEKSRSGSFSQTPGKNSLKASLLQNASFESGNQARKYFLLLNHRDLDQAEAALGTAQDQRLVEDVLDYLSAEKDLNNKILGMNRNKSFSWKDEQSMKASARTWESLVSNARTKLEEQEEVLQKHMSHYAKQLVLHRNSLNSLERLADSGLKSRPPGYAERIAKLEKFEKDTPSVQPVFDRVSSRKPQDVLEGAKMFGNPSYISSAEALVASEKSLASLDEKKASLEKAAKSIESEKVQKAISEEIADIEKNRAVSVEERERANKKLELFYDDLKLRIDREKDVSRELAALKKISS